MRYILTIAFAFIALNSIFAQSNDSKKGTIKVRKPYNHEFYIELDTALVFTKGNLLDFIEKKIVYTPDMKQGARECTVWVSCIVDESGNVTFVDLKKGCDAAYDKEAMRVISSLKGFKPLMKNNKSYAAKFDIPVKFKKEVGTKH